MFVRRNVILAADLLFVSRGKFGDEIRSLSFVPIFTNLYRLADILGHVSRHLTKAREYLAHRELRNKIFCCVRS